MNEWQSDTDTRIRICEVQGMSVTYREIAKRDRDNNTGGTGRIILAQTLLAGANFR